MMMPAQPPPLDLGAKKSDHPVTKSARWVGLVVGGLVLLGAMGLVLNGVYMGLMELEKRRPEVLDVVLPSFIGATLCVPIAGLLFFYAWRMWPVTASLYERGFTHATRKGTEVFRWDAIDAVWQSIVRRYVNGVYAGTHYRYTVQAKDGRRVVLDDRITHVEPIGSTIVKESAQALFPAFVRALEAGQRVSFGPIAIDNAGMYSGSKSLAWNQIKAVKIERGIVSVAREGGWFSWTKAMVPSIPNFFVLLALLRRFTKVE